MITMKEAREKAYELPDYGAKDMAALAYVEHLGAVTNTPIDNWPVNTFFIESTEFPHTEKNTLNQLFFKMKEACPPETPKEILVDQVIADKVNRTMEIMMNSMLHGQERTITRVRRDIESLAENMMDHQRKLILSTRSLVGLRKLKDSGNLDFRQQITSILSSGFYTYADSQPYKAILFKTKEIVLSHFDKDQGQEHVVPMGYYFVEFKINNDGLIACNVSPGDKNPCTGGLWHPHISTGGAVCYGNMLIPAEVAAASMELGRLASMVQDVLTNYCDDNPYDHLYNFKTAFKDGVLSNKGTIPPQGYSGYEEPEERDEEPEEEPEDDQDNF